MRVFFKIMGVDTEVNKEFGRESLSEFLRERVKKCMERGYSK